MNLFVLNHLFHVQMKSLGKIDFVLVLSDWYVDGRFQFFKAFGISDGLCEV